LRVFVVDVKSDIHPTRLRVDPLYAYPRASKIDRVEFRGNQETVVPTCASGRSATPVE
jgi:hypothetical protein